MNNEEYELVLHQGNDSMRIRKTDNVIRILHSSFFISTIPPKISLPQVSVWRQSRHI